MQATLMYTVLCCDVTTAFSIYFVIVIVIVSSHRSPYTKSKFRTCWFSFMICDPVHLTCRIRCIPLLPFGV